MLLARPFMLLALSCHISLTTLKPPHCEGARPHGKVHTLFGSFSLCISLAKAPDMCVTSLWMFPTPRHQVTSRVQLFFSGGSRLEINESITCALFKVLTFRIHVHNKMIVLSHCSWGHLLCSTSNCSSHIFK